MYIDSHIHFTPPSMAEDLETFSELEPYWGLLITPDPVNHTVQGWATPEQMIADMDLAGIDKVVLQGVYRQTEESTRRTNDDTLNILHQYQDRVIGFAVLHFQDADRTLDELNRCLDGGMKGVGELNPYGQGITFDNPVFQKVIEACIDYQIPLNLHVSEEIGHFYLGKSTTPIAEYYRVACRYPELKLILSHWGGGLLFYEILPEVRQNLKNVWYDTAGSPLLYPTPGIFHSALQVIDHRKLLFGSDYPLIICPSRQQQPDFRPFLGEINSLELPQPIYDDIMGGNAARLFGLMESDDLTETGKPDLKLTAPNSIITEIDKDNSPKVTPYMAVTAVCNAWPETQAVFAKYGISWQNSPVPFWEPIAQAAAAHGLGPTARKRLLEELNWSIGY
ncbi:MAG: amidohydrolase [Chloroflexi bacterium]|nr:MAG: amidohydrolase [Chloroflexota bacterium]